MSKHISEESVAPVAPWTGEKTAWWIVFGAITLGIVAMLGLWN